MEETGRPSPMDTRLGTGEARPYPLQPQGEVEAWEEEGALWGEVRARLCLVGALEAPTQRANPKVALKLTATTPVDKEDGGPSAPVPTGSGMTR